MGEEVPRELIKTMIIGCKVCDIDFKTAEEYVDHYHEKHEAEYMAKYQEHGKA